MRFLTFLLLFSSGFLHAQEEAWFILYILILINRMLNEKQGEELINFIKKIDSTRIEN
jgi:hypothetical protein